MELGSITFSDHAQLHAGTEPLPRFSLHLAIELVRDIVPAAPLTVGYTGLAKTGFDLRERLLDAIPREQRSPGTIHDEHRAGGNQRGEIRRDPDIGTSQECET